MSSFTRRACYAGMIGSALFGCRGLFLALRYRSSVGWEIAGFAAAAIALMWLSTRSS